MNSMVLHLFEYNITQAKSPKWQTVNTRDDLKR
jgi:hypothetical protein